MSANRKSISHRFHLFEVAFVWHLTKETIHLSLGCLQGGRGAGLEAAEVMSLCQNRGYELLANLGELASQGKRKAVFVEMTALQSSRGQISIRVSENAT